MRVYKYELPLPGESPFTVEIPSGFEVLHLALQSDNTKRGPVPCLWAAVDTAALPARWRFQWVPTGAEVADHATHLGTVLFLGGALVYHLFMFGVEQE